MSHVCPHRTHARLRSGRFLPWLVFLVTVLVSTAGIVQSMSRLVISHNDNTMDVFHVMTSLEGAGEAIGRASDGSWVRKQVHLRSDETITDIQRCELSEIPSPAGGGSISVEGYSTATQLMGWKVQTNLGTFYAVSYIYQYSTPRTIYCIQAPCPSDSRTEWRADVITYR